MAATGCRVYSIKWEMGSKQSNQLNSVRHKRFSSVQLDAYEAGKKNQIIIGNTAKQYLLFYEVVSSVQMISCRTLLGSDVIARERMASDWGWWG